MVCVGILLPLSDSIGFLVLTFFIAMGDIQAETSIVSSIAINPRTGQMIAASEFFIIIVYMSNIVANSLPKPMPHIVLHHKS